MIRILILVIFLRFLAHEVIDFFLGKDNIIPSVGVLGNRLFQLFQVDGNSGNAQRVCAVLVGLSLSICGEGYIGVLENVVFQVLHRALAPNKKKRVAVVQHTHFIRGHKLPSGSLKVGGVASAAALGLAVGVGVNGLLPQQLGHILMGGLFIAAQV